jgi:hypothetical protein
MQLKEFVKDKGFYLFQKHILYIIYSIFDIIYVFSGIKKKVWLINYRMHVQNI